MFRVTVAQSKSMTLLLLFGVFLELNGLLQQRMFKILKSVERNADALYSIAKTYNRIYIIEYRGDPNYQRIIIKQI